jgi:biopolymer transport protein ExbD
MKIKIPESSKVRIEIVPLIDVMFLVLASFVYATLSMAIHKGIVVKLPFSKVVEVQEQGKISVAIDENGIVYVEKTQVKLEELRKY